MPQLRHHAGVQGGPMPPWLPKSAHSGVSMLFTGFILALQLTVCGYYVAIRR